jgi:hypothetical protein
MSAGCRFCDSWTENGTDLFCKAHETRWRQLGCPDAEEFIALCLLRGKATQRLPRPGAAAQA